MEVQIEQARLADTDPESLKSMYKSLDETRQATQKRQLDTIKSTIDASKANGSTYDQMVSDLMKAAGDSGLNVDKPGFEKAAQAL